MRNRFPLFFASVATIAALLSVLSSPAQAQNSSPPLSATDIKNALNSNITAPATLAQRIRDTWKADELKNGARPKMEDLTVAWAIDAPGLAAGETPRVVSEDGAFVLPLKRVDGTDLYTGTATLPEGVAMRWAYQVGGEKKGGGQLEAYTTPPENKPRADVPKGKVTQMPEWKSNVFGGTVRDWWVYVPAQYTPDKPAAVMIFQDGGGVVGWVPTCFDNMIASGEIPVTVGIFINPGKFAADGRNNRSFEYDTLSDQYARFLLEEILPEVEKTTKLRHDAAGRATVGGSSGGICAFTAAWEKPDQFGKVVSWIGSYVNLKGGATGIGGGHNYPTLIRQSKTKNAVKPIRVFLQDGANDLDNPFGHWPLANQSMAKALAWAGYDYKLVWGNGFHSGSHGKAIFPDTLRWIWRDEPKATATVKPLAR